MRRWLIIAIVVILVLIIAVTFYFNSPSGFLLLCKNKYGWQHGIDVTTRCYDELGEKFPLECDKLASKPPQVASTTALYSCARGAARNGELSICDSLRDDELNLKSACIENLAIDKLDVSLCHLIPIEYRAESFKYRCIKTIASRKNDPSILNKQLCDSLIRDDIKKECLSDVTEILG